MTVEEEIGISRKQKHVVRKITGYLILCRAGFTQRALTFKINRLIPSYFSLAIC